MYNGFASWIAYIIALVQEMGSHLFVPGSEGFQWQRSGGEFVLVSAKLPQVSSSGKDVVDSLMTILHNVAIFLAQVSTLLPANTPQA
jgi:hypothetical protein